MSTDVIITLQGKTFKLSYGVEVFIRLGEIWGFDTLEEVNDQFQVLTTMGGAKGTSLSNIRIVSEIIEGMITGNPENENTITAAQIRSCDMGEFQMAVMKLTEGFVKNMPPASESDSEKKTPTRKRKASR